MIFLLRNVLGFVFARLTAFLIAGFLIVLVAALFLAGRHYLEGAERRADEAGELIALREAHSQTLTEQLKEVARNLGEPLAEIRDQIEGHRSDLEQTAARLRDLHERVRGIRRTWLRMKSWFSKEAARELETRGRERETLEAQHAEAKLQTEILSAREQGLKDTLESEAARLSMERDGVDADIARLREEKTRLEEIAAGRKRLWDVASLWVRRGFAASLPVLALLAFAIFLLPPLVRVFLYHVWGRLAQRAQPVRLGAPGVGELPVAGSSSPALELRILPGERVMLHHPYYQASDAGLKKHTRFLFDWRFPFTSLACRLFELTEVTNPGPDPGRITVSNQADATCEVALVELPAGTRLVLRPSYLVALQVLENVAPGIRSRWCFRRLHAWITLQFRYFEFEGPCRLVVRGRRGVRAESVESEEKTRVTNRSSTLGFTPSLAYHSRRAETFWSYFRGKNPLFDDAFSGHGLFLCQQVSAEEGWTPTRFWRGIGEAFFKAFGL